MYTAIVFLPLLGAIIAGFFGRQIGDRGSQIVTCGAMLIATVLGVIAFIEVALGGEPRTIRLMTWISSGSFEADWALRFDTLTVVMILVVTVVSTCVHVYSVGYMSHDPSKPRFMAYLSLFTFAMLMLVTADNLVQLFFGWEGVGLASYLLIGFWFHKPSANKASIKAFVVNRVGDFGFALGILGVYLLFDTVQFDAIFAAAPDMVDRTLDFLWIDGGDALTIVSILLFIGAMGKSAQLGLHTWLPDAMEGPTPVSALIHAATMVTAGVFMVARLSPMMEFAPTALEVVTVVGALTAFFAATVGLCQNDIKRVIAYSTCSQLGYMFFALGVGAYPAAIFHLMTHAFFKALLFLSAGSVIHAIHDEQDMRNMGGLWRKIPYTYAMMWIGSLALAGIPFFAGYYSKDIMLEAAYGAHSSVGTFAFWMGIAAAVMTAFYSWRLLYMTFHGKPRMDQHTFDHAHESPPVMMGPLVVLAIGAVLSGFVAYDHFVGDGMAAFWGDSILMLARDGGETIVDMAHHVPTWVKLLPFFMGLIGIAAATLAYILKPGIPAAVSGALRPLYLFLLNKWYFDELFDWLFVKRSFQLGEGFWKGGDKAIIDGFGPDGIAATARELAGRASRLQTGYVYHYAFAMLIGVSALITWYIMFGG
jgi:NADH-quinone oxidoreductase subunit L